MRDGFPFDSADTIGLSADDDGPEVVRLKGYLRQFGYLRPECSDHPETKEPDETRQSPSSSGTTFDRVTVEALMAFQRQMGLPESGWLDPGTAAVMALPRCGVTDRPKAAGDAWPNPNLRYSIDSITLDLPIDEIRAALQQAFAAWERVSPLTFVEVGSSAAAEIRIRFEVGAHGDSSPFDGPGNTVAHAYYPPPPAGEITGDMHFDDDETWAVALPTPGGSIDLISVAVHELGHSLGLDHSSDSDSVMYAIYSGVRRTLGQDDVRRIQQLYGGSLPPPPPPLDPWADPAVRTLIDEWIRQTDTCVKRIFPGAWIDMWGRMCGRYNNVIASCNQNPDCPPGWDSYRYVWVQNWAPMYYRFTVRQYVDLRQGGASYDSLRQCLG